MILITGGDGFIGKKLVVLVKKKFPKERVFVVRETEINLVTKKGFEKLPKNPKIVFHLAAATDTSKSDQRCNNIGTKNLIEALEIGPKTKFIFTSSQAIFSGRVNTNKPIDKDGPCHNNKYGKTKIEAEKILQMASKKQGFKLTIIRLPTVWGDNPRKNAFLNFLKEMIDQNSFISRLNWPGKVALINVDDATKFIIGLTRSVLVNQKVINIAVENLTLAEIFEKIYISKRKKYKQIKVPNLVWNTAKFLRRYLKYFEPILPAFLYNYFWRASIIVDSPLWCKVNLKGIRFNGS